MLAHQGGWDELLLAAGLVLAMLGVSRLRRRAGTTPRSQPDDVCPYCGKALEPDAVRCPSCGFRTGDAAE
jgi:predicted amidophosphoribosyltransferase